MFEALRGLRDAVAPESGNLGNNNNRNVVAAEPLSGQQQHDPPPPQTPEELWVLYQAGDESTRQQLHNNATEDVPPTALVSQAAFIEWYTSVERQKDAALVETLARAVLRQSAAIDTAVDQFTTHGYRTRTEQWQYMQELMQLNAQAATQLEEAYAQALERRNQCRQFVLDGTSRALGIEETK